MDKPALRRDLRHRRRAFVEAIMPMQLAEMQDGLVHRLAPHLAGAAVVSAYVATAGEIDPIAILRHAAAAGLRLALPRVVAREMPMTFHCWAPGDALVAGPFGLTQPPDDARQCDPDLILAPLLGFDRALGRIGQGAGFYDRAFAAHPAARRIGLAWSVQEVATLPIDPWDVPLDGVATEREWIGA